ncbi:hypothetical protein C6V92_08615 [Clostridium perfringens]|nr:hypothetical protein C6V94_10120 [Clostridium perfringens]RXI83446.1 hypothetical protein C6V96_08130 [Clostridium perfringens]RXI84240.1 hypothetical protein C6V92_08615 [Clostridium perfringens]RXI86538.1 hypothetical protein C6V95_09990 [Clostridium perfringens]RXI90360.1 hypothetical protein C6V93_08390 [Clostridium perfringens]
MFFKLLIYTFLLLELYCKLKWLFFTNSIESFKKIVNSQNLNLLPKFSRVFSLKRRFYDEKEL